MRILAISADEDPLFVRDDDGFDYEIEARWTGTTPSPRREDAEEAWGKVWASVVADGRTLTPGFAKEIGKDIKLGSASLLVKPNSRFLVANYLPSLAKRSEEAQRGRTLVRLGGQASPDEVVKRRRETPLQRQRLIERGPHGTQPSEIFISGHEILSAAMQFESVYRNGKVVSFANVIGLCKPHSPSNIVAPSNIIADIKSAVDEIDAFDEAQERRAKALGRLQDPPVASNLEADDIRTMIHGLLARPVM